MHHDYRFIPQSNGPSFFEQDMVFIESLRGLTFTLSHEKMLSR
ncbi:hypothetical protein RSOCI_02830 [Rhabdochlamydiaceae symbiont of Dictyostelium giganteum]